MVYQDIRTFSVVFYKISNNVIYATRPARGADLAKPTQTSCPAIPPFRPKTPSQTSVKHAQPYTILTQHHQPSKPLTTSLSFTISSTSSTPPTRRWDSLQRPGGLVPMWKQIDVLKSHNSQVWSSLLLMPLYSAYLIPAEAHYFSL